MKCMCVDDTGQTLIEKEIPQPAPQAGEVLIRVHAAGVTSSELEHMVTFEPELPSEPRA